MGDGEHQERVQNLHPTLFRGQQEVFRWLC